MWQWGIPISTIRQSAKVMCDNEASLYQHEMGMGFKYKCCDEYMIQQQCGVAYV